MIFDFIYFELCEANQREKGEKKRKEINNFMHDILYLCSLTYIKTWGGREEYLGLV